MGARPGRLPAVQRVVKDNILINAAYRLSLIEQRLILMAIVGARETGQGIRADSPLMVRAENYSDQFNISIQAAYMALREAINGLFDRQLTYLGETPKGSTEVVKSRWVSQVSYIDSEGAVSIIFAPAVIPLITRLESEFTHYDLDQVSGLKSAHAVRIYELIISWRSKMRTPVIPLNEFRRKLGIAEDEYQRMHHLKSRVLDLAISQINEHTDILAEYEQHKRGRSIVGFSFSFTMKAPPARDPNTVDWVDGKTDAEATADKPRRTTISKSDAVRLASPGETWEDLYKRLSRDHIIKG